MTNGIDIIIDIISVIGDNIRRNGCSMRILEVRLINAVVVCMRAGRVSNGRDVTMQRRSGMMENNRSLRLEVVRIHRC